MSKKTLYCLPHAGGSAVSYWGWRQYLHDSVELVPVELAGKGKRFNEPMYENVDEATEDILRLISEQHKEGSPYFLYGHSMGALLLFELLHKLKGRKHALPECAFLSGRKPPHYRSEKIYHQLPDEAFLKEIIGMGGTPENLLENQELRELFLPILRKDFKLVETYTMTEGRGALSCPLVIMYGLSDTATPADIMQEWDIYSEEPCRIYGINGGHFFVYDQASEVVPLITKHMFTSPADSKSVHISGHSQVTRPDLIGGRG